jgi:malonate transporter
MGWKLPSLISFLKLVVHPLVVLLLATQVFQMPPVWAGVAVLFASCPSGINAYLFAERYGEGVALASSAVTLSTFLALGSTLVWLYVLGVG